MPKIPGVPGLDPVNHPSANPSEFGRGGAAVAQMGDTLTDITLQQQGLDLYMKKAQEHVDTLAARNQLDAAYADIQNQLAKTPNSRDVPDVIANGNKTLNDISARWSKSPAAVAIQMDADGLRPSLSHVGTVRQVDLMGKELKISLNTQAESLANDYATGSRDAATAAFGTAVMGGVKTGLLGDAEAGEYMRLFKQKGQELQIKNAITNANPEVNQKIYETIDQHRSDFPDVTQEQLDTYKGQALAAFEAHTKFQDWAEGEMARKTMLVPKIDQFTNPATGIFDEGAAMKDNADRFAAGEITETQSKVLASGFSSHQAQLQVGMKQEANKRLDAIEATLSKHDFVGAKAQLEQNQPWFENNGFADDYRAALHYVDTQEREVRAEAAARRAEQHNEYFMARQIAQEESQDTLGEVQHFIAGGGMLTKADLQSMAGKGKGKMLTRDVDAAWKIMDQFEKEPDFAAAMKQLDDSFPAKSTAKNPLSAEQVAAQNRKYADTVELFQQEVNKHPDQSKQEIMNGLLKTKAVEDVKAHANAMFGVDMKSKGAGLRESAIQFLRSIGSSVVKEAPPPTPPAPKPPSATTPATIRVKDKASGKTGTIPASEFDDKVYEKVQ